MLQFLQLPVSIGLHKRVTVPHDEDKVCAGLNHAVLRDAQWPACNEALCKAAEGGGPTAPQPQAARDISDMQIALHKAVEQGALVSIVGH